MPALSYTHLEAFMPSGAADLYDARMTINDAKAWCALRHDCGGFTCLRDEIWDEDDGDLGHKPHITFKRTSEWYADGQRLWLAFIKQLTPCETLAYRTHASGLSCCEGKCPPATVDLVECARPVHLQYGVLPSCSELDAPPTAPSELGARSWPPTRVLNLARAGGVAQMSSAYDSTQSAYIDPALAIDGSLDASSMIHTACGKAEWWHVDLPTESEVHEVAVVNRGDYRFRLLSFELRALDAAGHVLATQPFVYASNRSAFAFRPPLRQVSRIELRTRPRLAPQCLHVHEVEVIGRASNSDAQHRQVVELLGLLRARAPGSAPREPLRSILSASRNDAVTPQMLWTGLAGMVALVCLQVRHAFAYLWHVRHLHAYDA
jgi:hypothetical protein